MGIVDMLRRSFDQTGAIIEGITPEQMDLPTPCGEWNVRAVTGHLVRGNENLAAVAEGAPRQPDPIAEVGDDPAGTYGASAASAAAAWGDAALLDGEFPTPFGAMPGRTLLTLRLADTVTHGWDLARATGQIPHYDEDIVQTALAFVQGQFGVERRPATIFAPPVATADDLATIDRLAAFLGRRP